MFVAVSVFEVAQRAHGGSESSASSAIGPPMERLAGGAVK